MKKNRNKVLQNGKDKALPAKEAAIPPEADSPASHAAVRYDGMSAESLNSQHRVSGKEHHHKYK